jgi:hypothetical protein
MTTEEKIRKLLDLASSPYEAEATLAMNKARELMAKYCIQIDDAIEEKPEVTFEYYAPPIRLSNANFKYATMIVHTLSKHFGVMPVIYNQSQIKLYGFPRSITLARYAFDAIFNQLFAEFRKGYAKERSITFTEAFWYGAALGIQDKFRMDEITSNALTVYDPVRAKIQSMNLGVFNAEVNADNVAGKFSGQDAGSKASFYKGISNQQQRGNLLS